MVKKVYREEIQKSKMKSKGEQSISMIAELAEKSAVGKMKGSAVHIEKKYCFECDEELKFNPATDDYECEECGEVYSEIDYAVLKDFTDREREELLEDIEAAGKEYFPNGF